MQNLGYYNGKYDEIEKMVKAINMTNNGINALIKNIKPGLYEYEVADFLRNECHVDDVLMHDRTIINPYEIDIIVPSKSIGIEYDGLYHHSEIGGGKPKTYHSFKTNEAKKHGYQLIHIFEDEWLYKQDIVK